ncbi:hypothetical protein [Martelella sp. FOR1707]
MTDKPGYGAKGISTDGYGGSASDVSGGKAQPNLWQPEPGRTHVRQIVEDAQTRCPFSNATRSNVVLALNPV